MSRQTVIVILIILGVVAVLVAIAMVSPEAARALGYLLRLITLIGRAF